MSRIGRKPVPVPAGVDVQVQDGEIQVKGTHGELKFRYHPAMTVNFDGEARQVEVARPDNQRSSRELHGLTRTLIANMVAGVQEPFVRKLEIQGVGYNAQLNNNELALQVGFANTVRLPVPGGVKCELPDPTHIVLSSCDKQAVGQFAANVRAVRPPEPYKGKGIRYDGEHVRRKAGKAFGAR